MTETHFLNIDLDIESETDISQLVDELGQSLTLMGHHEVDGRYYASFENEGSEISDIVSVFIGAISSLSTSSANDWKNCNKREFNFGFQAEDQPKGYVSILSKEILLDIIRVDAQIGITIYAPERNFA